ncbi:MAG TPA: hypothetical protein VGM51_06880 [Armatimonadota bacterium]|jgi:hypothetical protein
MSLTLTPRNRSIGSFQMGSWSWGYLLEMAGPVIPGFVTSRGRWYLLEGDPRWKDLDYPAVLGDSGRHFYIRADEAKHLARVARNWADIQTHLDESHRAKVFGQDEYARPFPEKVRDDWAVLFHDFSDWAERSRGFSK